MNTKKYNKMLDDILSPEIERLKRREDVSLEILAYIEEKLNVDYCGMQEWQIIDGIGKIINKLVK